MTGAGKVSVTRVGDIGYAVSGAGSHLAIAAVTGQPLPTSYRTHINRHISHVAAVFMIGIRGATPPPAG